MATEQGLMAVIRASRPTFRGPHDKLAFTLHAAFLSAGYSLIAAGTSAFSDDALTSPSTGNYHVLHTSIFSYFHLEIKLMFFSCFFWCLDEVGIEGWNEYEDNYAFVYSNPDKGFKKILVKCLSMNDSLLVDAFKDGDSEPLHLEIK